MKGRKTLKSQHEEKLKMILDFTQIYGEIIGERQESKVLLRKSFKKLQEIFECKQVRIFDVTDEGKNLTLVSFATLSKKGGFSIQYKIDRFSLPGSCVSEKEILVFDDVQKDLRHQFFLKHEEETIRKSKSMILAPLIFQGEILGVLQVLDLTKGKFKEEHKQLMKQVAYQMALMEKNRSLLLQLKQQFLQVCQAFADTIGKKDKYTGGHTKRVGFFSEMIGKELKLSTSELDDLRLAGVLHDIGKIGIEDKILKKKAPLTDEEFAIMKNHPRLGYEILAHVRSLGKVLDGMRFHHERPDGKGYPYGLKGDEIPVMSQIISLADTFDAMISHRPYRRGMLPYKAHEEIIKNKGTQFSKQVVEAFDRVFRRTKMFRNERFLLNAGKTSLLKSSTKTKEKKVIKRKKVKSKLIKNFDY